MVKESNLSGQIISYLGGLHLAGGDHDGAPFKVLPWERRFIRGAFAEGAEVSALSIARGNGKSCLLAGVAASGVAPGGPLQGNRREIVCVASSFMQARIIFEDVRIFRRACAEGKVTPTPSLLLRSAMSEARTVSDPAGNAKLSKGSQGGRRGRARDDAAAAAWTMARSGCCRCRRRRLGSQGGTGRERGGRTWAQRMISATPRAAAGRGRHPMIPAQLQATVSLRQRPWR